MTDLCQPVLRGINSTVEGFHCLYTERSNLIVSFTSHHFTSLHFTSLHFTSHHFTSSLTLYFTSHHFIFNTLLFLFNSSSSASLSRSILRSLFYFIQTIWCGPSLHSHDKQVNKNRKHYNEYLVELYAVLAFKMRMRMRTAVTIGMIKMEICCC